MKFPKLVIEEAKALRKYATKAELNELSFERLEPTSRYRCIYGQMTGECYSDRAGELIEKCARRVYNGLQHGVTSTTRKDLNGSPVGKDRYSYWSPIEVFIARDGRDGNNKENERLIKFLKGEIKTL